jgi:ribosomal protein S18 acetylase RimI-like enzyme/DNA-binding MarR family transcriptional regulator
MVDDLVRSFGYLTLGTRLKRLGERLQADVVDLSARHGFAVPAGLFPVLAAIDRDGAPTVGELAEATGVSQPAVTRSVGKLVDLGLVAVGGRDGDQRLKTAALTAAGAALVARARRLVWPAVETAVRAASRDGGATLLAELDAFEDNLAAAALVVRADALITAAAAERLARLDRPVWAALSTRHRPVSAGGPRARRYLPDIGPLAACRDDSADSLADLAGLVAAHGAAILLQAGDPPVPPGCRVELRADAVQMLMTDPGRLPEPDGPPAAGTDGQIEELGDSESDAMIALAALTAPGPFAARTHALGRFWGIRAGGNLVAMAGERMAFDGITEVSAVCTHPDFRGRGLAARLVARVVADIRGRGDDALLHAFAANTAAIRLYETLGFTLRREMTVMKLVPA